MESALEINFEVLKYSKDINILFAKPTLKSFLVSYTNKTNKHTSFISNSICYLNLGLKLRIFHFRYFNIAMSFRK